MHPYLFQFGHLVLPTYGFLVAAGTILSLLLCVRNARQLALDSDKIWTVALLSVVIYLLTSKLLMVLLYQRQYGLRALGMSAARDSAVSLIGVLTATVVALAYVQIRKLPLLRTADAVAPSLALSSAVVSIACLEAGCDYGTPTNLPWAIVFRQANRNSAVPVGVPLHPTQVYASLIAFVMFAVLLILLHRSHRDGEIVGASLFLAGLTNAALAPFRADPVSGLLTGSLTGYLIAGLVPVTQLLSAGMVLAGAILWLHRSSPVQMQVHG